MTREALVSIVTPLAAVLRQDIDLAQWRAYHHVLRDVPEPLLKGAVEHYLNSDARFMPTPGQLKRAAEQYRRSQLPAYTPCGTCMDGWVRVEENGHSAVRRCWCWHQHQRRVVEAGLHEPLRLSAHNDYAGKEEDVR